MGDEDILLGKTRENSTREVFGHDGRVLVVKVLWVVKSGEGVGDEEAIQKY